MLNEVLTAIDHSPKLASLFKSCPLYLLERIKKQDFSLGKFQLFQGNPYEFTYLLVSGQIKVYLMASYSGTLVKTKIDKFLNVSGSRHCSIKQQCREVALCWRDVPDG